MFLSTYSIRDVIRMILALVYGVLDLMMDDGGGVGELDDDDDDDYGMAVALRKLPQHDPHYPPQHDPPQPDPPQPTDP
jgi:hypothetical protein